MKLYKVLREHQKDIISLLVNTVSAKFNNKDPNKCQRDLEYIYSAITNDLLFDTDDNIRRIGSKFWHKGESQLKTTKVEFLIYSILEKELHKILTDDADKKKISASINQLIEIIKTGPDLYYTEEKLQNRRNVVKFNSTPVPLDLESIVDTCIENTPIQKQTGVMFLKLANTESDQEIKDFLVKNFFWNDQFNRHMIAVSTAPLVYVAAYNSLLNKNNRDITDNDNLHIGLHGGAVMQEVLNYGYDFAFIGCGPDNQEIPKSAIKEWKRIAMTRWGVTCYKPYPHPLLCFCIGKSDFEDINLGTMYKLPSGDIVQSQIFFKESPHLARHERPKKLFT
jgi:hypothetical protein